MTLVEACSELSQPGLREVCAAATARLETLSLNPLWSALIAGVVALLGVVVGGWNTGRLQRADRHNAAQREALRDLQDISGKLRRRSSDRLAWIRGGRLGDDPFPDASNRNLMGRFDIVLSRVADDSARTTYRAWLDYAKLYFSGSDEHELPEELKRWKLAVEESGGQFRRMDRY